MTTAKPEPSGFDPSAGPFDLDEFHWYYTEPEGISVIAELRRPRDGAYVGTTTTFLPWKKVREALARHDKKKARR